MGSTDAVVAVPVLAVAALKVAALAVAALAVANLAAANLAAAILAVPVAAVPVVAVPGETPAVAWRSEPGRRWSWVVVRGSQRPQLGDPEGHAETLAPDHRGPHPSRVRTDWYLIVLISLVALEAAQLD